MEVVKTEHASNAFDISKICRACLAEKDEMRSVYGADGAGVRLDEILMGFTTVQIESGDGLPGLLCLECAHQASQGLAFKQLCEQSDTNLRQYLGKPLATNAANKQKTNETIDLYNNSLLLDGFDLDDSSDNSEDEDDFKLNFETTLLDSDTEKLIAQKQLIKTSKVQKTKNGKKKVHKTKINKKLPTRKNNNQCNVCKKQFINLKSFRKHLRTHIEDRPFKCKLCTRAFTEENYLNNHMRTHIPEADKPHECTYCKKRFIHETLLKKHLLKHSGEKPFICKICNKGCYAENSLLKHMKIHERKQGDPALLKHMCDYCKSEFPNAQLLADHIKQHSGDRPFLCTICGKCFPQRFNLELHLRTHTGERPFACEVCKNGYVSKASLKIHMRTHTNERPFVCNFCGKAFRQSGDLTSHKRLHGTEKPIECSVCQKRFTTVMKLKYHMRNHTGERPYVCNVCGRGFTVNTILLRHMRVHSGERPYVCVTCGKAFSQSSTLNTHMKVHATPTAKFETVLLEEHAQTHPIQQRLPKFVLPTQTQTLTNNHEHEHDRLLQQQQTQMQLETARILSDDTARMLDNNLLSDYKISDNKLFAEPGLLGNVNNVSGDKYLNNYDPYHRGHL